MEWPWLTRLYKNKIKELNIKQCKIGQIIIIFWSTLLFLDFFERTDFCISEWDRSLHSRLLSSFFFFQIANTLLFINVFPNFDLWRKFWNIFWSEIDISCLFIFKRFLKNVKRWYVLFVDNIFWQHKYILPLMDAWMYLRYVATKLYIYITHNQNMSIPESKIHQNLSYTPIEKLVVANSYFLYLLNNFQRLIRKLKILLFCKIDITFYWVLVY